MVVDWTMLWPSATFLVQALGITMYVMLWGRVPWSETHNPIQLFDEIMNGKKIKFPNARAYDAEMISLLRRILERDVCKRITLNEIKDNPWLTNGQSSQQLTPKSSKKGSSVCLPLHPQHPCPQPLPFARAEPSLASGTNRLASPCARTHVHPQVTTETQPVQPRIDEDNDKTNILVVEDVLLLRQTMTRLLKSTIREDQVRLGSFSGPELLSVGGDP